MAPHTFEEMVVNRTPFLQQAALQLTRNTDQAQDLVQDTLLLALRHQQKFSEGSRLEAWLYTILRNSFINNYRKQQYRQQVGKRLEKEGWMAETREERNNGVSRMVMQTIYQKMEELPGIYKESLKLRLAGYQYTEIADMTGEHLGTTKSRIHFAKALLKKKLKDIMD
jgi:RNA polymerase sigma-70 factor (ECF subfamily)